MVLAVPGRAARAAAHRAVPRRELRVPGPRGGRWAPGGPGGAAMAVEFDAYAAFERELLGDLVPFIEARYSVTADRMHRALAGCRWVAASR